MLVSGRGPTSDISPRKTCQNCGISSIECRRQKAANRLLTRGSRSCLPSSGGSAITYSIQPRPRDAAVPDSHIDLSFNIQNGRLCLPILRCATSGDLLDRADTTRAELINNGLVSSSRKIPAPRSAISAAVNCRSAGTRSSWMLGSMCYLEYTAQMAGTEGLYNLFAFFLQRPSQRPRMAWSMA